MIKFEVFDPFGKIVMTTDSPAAVPAADVLQAMAGAGYKFKMDGKAYKVPAGKVKTRGKKQ